MQKMTIDQYRKLATQKVGKKKGAAKVVSGSKAPVINGPGDTLITVDLNDGDCLTSHFIPESIYQEWKPW